MAKSGEQTMSVVSYNTAPFNVVSVKKNKYGGPWDNTVVDAWSPSAFPVAHFSSRPDMGGKRQPVAPPYETSGPMAVATMDGVMHLVHPLYGFRDCIGVANIASDEFYALFNFGQPAWRAARIIVEHAHMMVGADEGFHKSGADEAAAASDENTAHARTPFVRPACVTSVHVPDWCARRAASINTCTR